MERKSDWVGSFPHFPYHIIIFVGLALLLILVFGWFLVPRDDGSLAEIRRRGTLRVGLDASFPPFEMIDEATGQIVGLDVDLARAMAADLGVGVELVNIGFDGLYDALLARRVDLIISGLPYDPRWTQDIAYSINYFNAGQVLVTQAGETTIKTGEDLAGRVVAVEWGSQAEMEGRRLTQALSQQTAEVAQAQAEAPAVSPGLTLQRQATAAEALAALLNGQAEAAIVDAPSAISALPKRIKIVTYLTDEWYAAAVHRDSRELLEAINQTLMRLEEQGKLAKLQADWFHAK